MFKRKLYIRKRQGLWMVTLFVWVNDAWWKYVQGHAYSWDEVPALAERLYQVRVNAGAFYSPAVPASQSVVENVV